MSYYKVETYAPSRSCRIEYDGLPELDPKVDITPRLIAMEVCAFAPAADHKITMSWNERGDNLFRLSYCNRDAYFDRDALRLSLTDFQDRYLAPLVRGT